MIFHHFILEESQQREAKNFHNLIKSFKFIDFRNILDA